LRGRSDNLDEDGKAQLLVAQLLEPPATAFPAAARVEDHAQGIQDSLVPEPRELPQRLGEERLPDGVAVELPGERGVPERLERGARHVGGERGEGEHGGGDGGGAAALDEGVLVELVAREEVAEEAEAQEQEARRGGREEEEGVGEHVGEALPALRGPGCLYQRGEGLLAVVGSRHAASSEGRKRSDLVRWENTVLTGNLVSFITKRTC